MRISFRALLVSAGLLLLAVAAGAEPDTPKPPANDDCLACHGDATAKRANGTPIAVDQKGFEASKHAAMACVDCHQDLASLKEFPHPDQLARVNCASCHDSAQEQFAAGVHAQSRRNGQLLAAKCVDCHGMHDIKGSAEPTSPTNHLNLPGTCAKCHGNQDVIDRGHIQIGNVAAKYRDSIHGRALEKSGLLVAPSCVDCHGNHDITRRTDARSRVFRANIPATCGTCHAGILQHYNAGVHAAALENGDAKAPVCADCHTAHAIQRADTDTWRLSVTAECGTCHSNVVESFRRTFHGKVTELGFTRVAACADCHGAHDILPASNPASMVSPARLVSTCGTCHPGATASFVKYDPHPNPRSYDRGRMLWWANTFYWVLIPGCFGFFGLHSVLWFWRSSRNGKAEGQPLMTTATVDRPAHEAARTPAPALQTTKYLVRFDLHTRILHGVVMVTFLGLAATGMPLLFSEAPWGRGLARVFGGFQGAGLVHRFFGVVLLAAVAWHVAQVLWRALVRGEKGLLWGPSSMVPQPSDFVDFYRQLRWFVGLGPRPRFEHFTYWEKFDYWAVLWGTGLMGAAGLVLWFPQAASRVLPGWMFNVALFVHGAEATLAIGFIFVVHFFNGHLRPEKFPMDLVIFTGAVADHELREERAALYDRLVESGELDRLVVAPPAEALVRRGRLIGTAGLTMGVALIVLIVYAVLR